MKLKSLLFGLSLLALSACEEQGPAEELGEDIDEGAAEVRDSIEDATQPGPAERAGENIDDAVDEVTN